MNTVNGIARPHTGRRVVRRRQGTLDQAIAVAFEGLPVELHQPLMAWVDARKAEHQTRQALSTALTHCGTRWFEIEKLARELAFG